MSNQFAFVFPGQGSQSVGMLSQLAEKFPAVKTTFAEASAALNYDLWQLVQQGPEELLNQTQHTQPALLTASIAIWRIWQQQGGPVPTIMAGHSLGEYSALVCAEVLDFSQAVTLVAERGQFMQEAVPEGKGAMAAIIGLDEKQVQELCELNALNEEVLAPANINAIGQIVIAGNTAAVDRAIVHAKEIGAKIAKKIPVSAPSHCNLMKPAATRLAAKLANMPFKTPTLSVINNVDVTINTDPEAIKLALVRQLYNPVRWVETIQAIAAKGIADVIECGPGKVLLGLNKRINADMSILAIYDTDTLAAALQKM